MTSHLPPILTTWQQEVSSLVRRFHEHLEPTHRFVRSIMAVTEMGWPSYTVEGFRASHRTEDQKLLFKPIGRRPERVFFGREHIALSQGRCRLEGQGKYVMFYIPEDMNEWHVLYKDGPERLDPTTLTRVLKYWD